MTPAHSYTLQLARLYGLHRSDHKHRSLCLVHASPSSALTSASSLLSHSRGSRGSRAPCRTCRVLDMQCDNPQPYRPHLHEHPYRQPLEEGWTANSFDGQHLLHLQSDVDTLPSSVSVSPLPADVFLDDDAVGTSHLSPGLSPTASFLSFSTFSPTSQQIEHTSSDGSGVASPLSPLHIIPASTASSASRLLSEVEDSAEGNASVDASILQRQSRRRQCKCACVPCRNAKTSCDESRPCIRCRTQRDPSLCVDRPDDEVERGRLKRRRKPTSTAQPIDVNQLPPRHHSTLHYELLVPYHSVAALAPVRDHSPSQSSAVCLAAVQSTGMRNFFVSVVEQLVHANSGLTSVQRKKAVRAIQVGLAHLADHLTLDHFNTFLRGSSTAPTASSTASHTVTSPSASVQVVSCAPSSTSELHSLSDSPASVPLPAILQAWSHPTTRPVFLEWSSTPSLCAASQEGSDADIATVRVRFMPAAKTIVQRWESRQQHQPEHQSDAQSTTDTTASITTAAATIALFKQQVDSDDSAISHIESKFSCLSMDDNPASALSNPSNVDTACVHRSHASWCTLQQPMLQTSDSSSTSPVCTCKDSVALPCVMLVNAAWERLFGWSQSEVRSEALLSGMRTESTWYRPDSWFAYHVLLGRHFQSQHAASDFRMFAIVKTKWGAELSCLIHKQLVCGQDGFTSSTLTFTPIANNA